MGSGSTWERSSVIMAVVQYCCVIMAFLFPLSLTMSDKIALEYGQGVLDFVVWVRLKTPWAVPIATALASLMRKLRKHIGSAKVYRAVHAILDQMQQLAFADRLNDGDSNPSHHRVTVFRLIRWRIGFPLVGRILGKWLLAVERSGELSRRTSVYFSACDERKTAEGIAGAAFALNRTIKKSKLPNVAKNCKRSRSKLNIAVKKYAKETFVSEPWVMVERPEGRSFIGMPLIVGGKKWGSLVFDSRSKKEIPLDADSELYLSQLACLCCLLEEI